jgi:hypothetical protein
LREELDYFSLPRAQFDCVLADGLRDLSQEKHQPLRT